MNDERPIEKLLRRAAKKRGDETSPPPELHPVNRRLLQDEVARQFPQPKAATQSPLLEWWTLLKRRWVYGVGVFAAIWIVALIVSPLLSKPKPKDMLAQNTAREISELLAAKKHTSALPPPVVASDMMTGSDRVALGYSEGAKQSPLAEPTAVAVAPVATAPHPTTFGREDSVRREFQNNAFALTDAAAEINQKPSANRIESKTKASSIKATTDEHYPAAPASIARPGGNSGRFGSAVATKSAAALTPLELKLESNPDAASTVAPKKEFAGPAVSSSAGAFIAAPAEAAVAAGMDKSWLARGGGTERASVERSSQAYSNLAAERLARKKDVDSLRTTPQVLVNFRIEQAGRDMRVVDGDGSIYTGVVDEKNTLYKQQLARQNLNLSNTYQQQFNFQTPKLTAAPAAAKTPVENYYFYRVEGTNRTLNQNVVFAWNFIDTNALADGNLNYNTAAQKFDATKPPAQFPELLQRSLINGRARFGPGREIEVNALPVPQ